MRIDRRSFIKFPAVFAVAYGLGGTASSNPAAKDVKTARENNQPGPNKKPTVEKMEAERALYKKQELEHKLPPVGASAVILGGVTYACPPLYNSKLKKLESMPENQRPIDPNQVIDFLHSRRNMLVLLGAGMAGGAITAFMGPSFLTNSMNDTVNRIHGEESELEPKEIKEQRELTAKELESNAIINGSLYVGGFTALTWYYAEEAIVKDLFHARLTKHQDTNTPAESKS